MYIPYILQYGSVDIHLIEGNLHFILLSERAFQSACRKEGRGREGGREGEGGKEGKMDDVLCTWFQYLPRSSKQRAWKPV